MNLGKVRISSRRSDLARLQSYFVGAALARHYPALEIEYRFKESLGDQNQEDPLWKMPARGVFTEDFVADLQSGETDLVVHSWKDLPTEPRRGLALAATPPRADPRDILLFRREALGKQHLTLLTSSPRRTFTTGVVLERLLPFPVKSLQTKPVRGNIATRLRKLAAGEGDGLFMAKAALDRLLSAHVTQEDFAPARQELRSLLDPLLFMVLPLSQFPTAPAQGALALEIRADREDLRELLAPLHDAATATAVERERARFSAFGGGCHQKIGITVLPHARLGEVEFFHGHPDGQAALRTIQCSPPPRPHGPRFWPESTRPVFARRSLAEIENPGGALFVARADALPASWRLSPDQMVWTAGLRTWEKLAARGVWVSGSSDGLGESTPEVKSLLGRDLPWTKLTHDQSGNDRHFPCLATYRLDTAQAPPPPLVDSYFWSSATLFLWAIQQRPEIRNARHAAGPGHTAERIEKELGRKIDVYYNYSQWKSGDAAHED